MIEQHDHRSRPSRLAWRLRSRPQVDRLVLGTLLGLFMLLFIAELFMALEWRMVHDTPNLHYVAFLIDRFDYVPYRDIFETNLPGSYLFHLAIGKLFGYGDRALRLVDAAWLLALLGVTWAALRPFGRRVAWGGAALFGLTYLQLGPTLTLQRDYLGLLPIMTAVWLSTHPRWRQAPLTAFFIGLLFGFTATVKPHLSIGLPLVLATTSAYRWRLTPEQPRAARLRRLALDTLLAGGGYALPVTAVFLWVWQLGAWPAFQELFSNYLPLYLQLDRSHSIRTGTARLRYLIDAYRTFGGLGVWLGPVALGLYLALFEAPARRPQAPLALLLASLIAAYSLYPALAGQFFSYHWIPLHYFLIVTAALVLTPLPQHFDAPRRLLPILVWCAPMLFLLKPAPDFLIQLRGGSPAPPKDGLVDDMVDALRTLGAAPGDSIQPLDWTGGAVHALLISEARLATPYIYDYYFYHHVTEPTIQTMRRRFMAALEAERPRFIVENSVKDSVKGPGASQEFPELRDFLERRYTRAIERNGFTIYARQ